MTKIHFCFDCCSVLLHNNGIYRLRVETYSLWALHPLTVTSIVVEKYIDSVEKRLFHHNLFSVYNQQL